MEISRVINAAEVAELNIISMDLTFVNVLVPRNGSYGTKIQL